MPEPRRHRGAGTCSSLTVSLSPAVRIVPSRCKAGTAKRSVIAGCIKFACRTDRAAV
ncbi:hypothetical protein KCP73_02180 [Salmonella enterica subsp. enterica]|nr:hypothetical protein KCP73_02180 [Salmonella enterica subsp. enterica]